MSGYVEVTRGNVVESRHVVHLVVAHATRGVIACCGDRHHRSFVRSAIKMFQALPLAEDGVIAGIGMSSEELALCTASHNAEPFHVAAAERLLARIGLDERALACGPHAPMYPPAAADLAALGEEPTRLHNNCSGKHAGMLALAASHGWPAAGYHQLEHPVQQRVLQTLASWAEMGSEEIAVAIDGCGLPTFALPLAAVAAACARFAAAGLDSSPAGTIIDAMTTHPHYVAGTGRLCTALMQTLRPRRVFAKVGAEGYYCAGVPDLGLGIALKVEDGAKRAAEPALLAALHTVGALSDQELSTLREFSQPAVLNTRGEIVGEIRARLALH